MNGAQSVTGTTSALIDSVTVQDLGRHEPYSELENILVFFKIFI